jgi:hypothetical protein
MVEHIEETCKNDMKSTAITWSPYHSHTYTIFHNLESPIAVYYINSSYTQSLSTLAKGRGRPFERLKSKAKMHTLEQV